MNSGGQRFELTTCGVRDGDANDYAKDTDSPQYLFLKKYDEEREALKVNWS